MTPLTWETCGWLLQSSALQDITTTPAHIAASAVQRGRTSGSLDRTTVLPAPETPPPTSTAPLTSCSAKVTQQCPDQVCRAATLCFCSKPLSWTGKQKLFNKCVSLYRPAVRRRARGFHWLHRVAQLPWKLPGQCGVYVDHQPTAQAQDPHRCPRDLSAYRGWVRRLFSHEKKL